MEASEEMTAGAVVTEETPSQVVEAAPAAPAVASPVVTPAPAAVPSEVPPAAALVVPTGEVKKKRGRPRKYAPDGSPVMPLNPTPISASMPAGEYRAASSVAAVAVNRGRARLGGSVFKQEYQPQQQQPMRFQTPGEMVTCSAGANFTPHVITVAAGEDVTMKLISFSQQGPRAICILSANGTISNVMLRQPDSSGGTLTYEGRFELLSLSGSFMPSESEGTRSRSGGMSVSLASPDGRVVGGGVAGLLVAAGPVQVVVGSFLPSYQLEQKPKKPRYESTSTIIPASAIRLPNTDRDDTYGGNGQEIQFSNPRPTLVTSSSFRGDNWSASPHAAPDTRNPNTD